MTRFARAKGSKASNERREEEATPWHVMRQQLADNISGNDSKANETKYDKKSILSNKSSSNKEDIWSDFGEPKQKKATGTPKKSKKKQNFEKVKINLSFQENEYDNVSKNSELTTEGTVSKSVDIEKVHKKRKLLQDKSIVKTSSKKKRKSVTTFGVQSLNENDHLQDHGTLCKAPEDLPKHETDVGKSQNKSLGNESKNKRKNCNLIKENKKSKNEKDNLEKLNKGTEEITSKCLANDDTPKNVQTNLDNTVTSKPKSLPKESKPGKININSNVNDRYPKSSTIHFQNSRYNSRTQSIFANDREIKVKPYEGFLVKVEDAKELTMLRKKLKSENIPQEQIKQIMKLERRKAEKALAREKTKVCFHCRKFGHKLSDCPEVDDKDLAKSGMCFKCGSTEHSYFDCKVSRGQDFRHAVCFVCKEQGHIARQCPLNPQGQYPRGGSCHLCGEVTHLRKDCPKAKEEQASLNNTVSVFIKNDLEEAKVVNDKNTPKKKSVVKF